MATAWETPLERVRRDYGLLRRYLEHLGADGVPASPPARGVKIVAPPLLRRENTASFEIRPLRVGYGWKDWGTDEAGTVIDLVMQGEHLDKPGDALAWLLDWIGETPAAEPARNTAHDVAASVGGDENSLAVRYTVSGVKNDVMREYLLGRGLSPRTFRLLHTVGWTDTEKPGSKYFGVGIRNLRGDWVCRSALTGRAGKRLVRAREEERNGGGGASCSLLVPGLGRMIDVVEGFLNGLALYDVGFAGGKILSLNGSAQRDQAAGMLARLAQNHPDIEIRLHADRGLAGEKARRTICDALEDVPGFLDLSNLYANGDAMDRLKADREALLRDLEAAVEAAISDTGNRFRETA